MDIKNEADCSYDEDEVFFGRLTLKEVKKRIFMDVHQKNTSLANQYVKDRNENNDFKIIETRSQPNIFLHRCIDENPIENLKSISDPIFNKDKQHVQLKIPSTIDCANRDSFLEMEKNVTEQCNSLSNCDKNNLDNTLDFVDFILNHAQSHNKERNIEIPKQEHTNFDGGQTPKDEILCQSTGYDEDRPAKVDNSIEKLILNTDVTPFTPMKCKQIDTVLKCDNMKPDIANALNTPITNNKGTSILFKTPKNIQSGKKDICAKKTPSRTKAYEHIASPIATYIRNCPQVPLVKDVHPKKPLPSTSLIPKPSKNGSAKCDKENVMLPPLAYRSAKKTLVIDVNKKKLPQSNWAQKLTSSSRKPVVLKHNHREDGKKPLLLQQDNSFQDLTLHQAEVSVCTQKSAFNKL